MSDTGIVTVFLKQPPAYELVLDVPWTEEKFQQAMNYIADHTRSGDWYQFEATGPLAAVPTDNIALITFTR